PLSAPLSERVRSTCQTRLWSLLDDLLPRPKGKLSPEEQKKKKKAEKKRLKEAAQQSPDISHPVTADQKEGDDSAEPPPLWALKAHRYWDAIEAAGFPLLSPLSEEGKEVRRSALTIVEEVEERRAQAAVGQSGVNDGGR